MSICRHPGQARPELRDQTKQGTRARLSVASWWLPCRHRVCGVDAIHMTGGLTVADMANKVFEVEVRFPIEFEAETRSGATI